MTYIFHLFTLIQKDFIFYSNLKSGQIVYKSTARRRAWASKTQHEAEVNLAVCRTPQNGFCGVLHTADPDGPVPSGVRMFRFEGLICQEFQMGFKSDCTVRIFQLFFRISPRNPNCMRKYSYFLNINARN